MTQSEQFRLYVWIFFCCFITVAAVKFSHHDLPPQREKIVETRVVEEGFIGCVKGHWQVKHFNIDTDSFTLPPGRIALIHLEDEWCKK